MRTKLKCILLAASLGLWGSARAYATIPYVDTCGTVEVNGDATAGVVIKVFDCETDEEIQLSNSRNYVLVGGHVESGAPMPESGREFNYHVVYIGPDDGLPGGTFGSYTPIEHYMTFTFGDCPPIVVTCDEIAAAYAATTDGKPIIDINIPKLGEIGDTVFCDFNRDGVQDAGEPGLEGVTVNLSCDDGLADSQVTDANGNYLFTGIPAGGCTVTVDQSTAPADCNELICAPSVDVDLAAGESYLDADFCFAPPLLGKLGDRVWFDENGDGIQDEGEPGVEGVTVLLGDCQGNELAGTTTDADGYYCFYDLEPGNYNVQVIPPEGYSFTMTDQGDDDCKDSDADFDGVMACTTLDAGEEDLCWDAGLVMCSECDGKVTQLTLQFDAAAGVEDAVIRVEMKGKKKKKKKKKGGSSGEPGPIVFDDTVPAGGAFTFNGADDKGTLGTEIFIYINNVLNTDIHTSCSKPIGPGLVSGSFTVLDGYSLFGGKLCEPTDTPDGGKCDGKVTRLSMEWNGSRPISVIAADVHFAQADIQPGEVVTISGYPSDGQNDVIWEIFDAASGDKLGESKFHRSCSDADMNDPTDCGTPQGDGKGNDTNFINTWLLRGLTSSGGSNFDCAGAD